MLNALPRSEWSSHPRYPAQVLLLGSHENFRRVSEHLVTRAEDPSAHQYVGTLYNRWIGAMRSHEAYEERKLYPFLADRWGVSFEQAIAGHEQLHDCDRAVQWALMGSADGGDPVTLLSALAAHDRALDAHLLHEEDLVIPALLELSPVEFRRFVA